MLRHLIALAQTRVGRAVAVGCGLTTVAVILRRIGFGVIFKTIAAAASVFPLILLCDAATLTCTMLALRTIYGAAGRKVPALQYARAGLIGYAVMGLMPAGRAMAEVTRASVLAPWVGSPRAVAGAGRLQGVALIANSLISLAAATAAWLAFGPSLLPLAIIGNFIITMGAGSALLIVGRRAHIGGWLGRRFGRVQAFGQELDSVLQNEPLVPWKATAWELGGRTVQVAQNAILIVAVGGSLGLRPALLSEGVHLVGAALGDLVPGQLGVIEANFTLSATALALPASAAVSIALLAHLSQLCWVLVGSLVPLLWPGPAHRPPPGSLGQPVG